MITKKTKWDMTSLARVHALGMICGKYNQNKIVLMIENVLTKSDTADSTLNCCETKGCMINHKIPAFLQVYKQNVRSDT